jgi:lysophospholipase L1-like esterase
MRCCYLFLLVAGIMGGAALISLADATIPTPEVDPERIDWWYGKHAQDTNALATLKPDILFMGDSITDYWNSSNDYGANIWNSYYANRNAYNIGISGDKIEELLWRIQNGVFAHNINPKVVVLMIGTNNRDDLTNRVDGIRLVIDYILEHTVDTKVLALGIFPREAVPNTELFQPVFNLMAQWPETNRVVIADIRDTFLLPGTSDLNPELFHDGRLHPNEDGYQCEAQVLDPYIAEIMGETNSIFTSVGVPSIPEGGTNTYSIRLFPAPSVNETVTVARVSGDIDLTVAGSSQIVFTPANGTNWMTVSIAASADLDNVNGSTFFRSAAPGRRSVDTKVSELDGAFGKQLLPFEETFESGDAGDLGAVNGQHGWISDSINNVVTTNQTHGGSQSLEIKSGSVSQIFEAASNLVQVSYWTMPSTGTTNPPVPAGATAAFWFGTNGQVFAYSNSALMEVTNAGLQESEWNRFDVSCNYDMHLWSLDINGTNVISDYGFYANLDTFSSVQFFNSDEAMYLDDLTVSNAVAAVQFFANGVPGGWLADHGLTVDDAGAFSDTDEDGFQAWEEWVAGTLPTNRTSKFKIITQNMQSTENMISWNPVVTGRLYSVYWSSNLLSEFEILASNLISGVFSDEPHGVDRQGFYRVEVRLAP